MDLRAQWANIRGDQPRQFILDWLDDAYDAIGDYRHWPAWFRANIRSGHLDYRQRFYTFMFFVRNGVEPERAADLVRRATRTDQRARDHLRSLAADAPRLLHRYSDARVWDLNNRRAQRY